MPILSLPTPSFCIKRLDMPAKAIGNHQLPNMTPGLSYMITERDLIVLQADFGRIVGRVGHIAPIQPNVSGIVQRCMISRTQQLGLCGRCVRRSLGSLRK